MPHDIDTDHYRVLGVARDASTHAIRRAYRRLARRHHPDHNPGPGGPEQFIALVRAYEILSDPSQRAVYDRTFAHRPLPADPPVTPRPRPFRQPVRHGVLELSPSEARHLARRPLSLTDGRGQRVVLPAGAGHGDMITLLYDDHRVVLTLQVQRNT